MSDKKIIKSPLVQDEACVLTVPDPESLFVLAQVAAAGDEETDERQLSSELPMEEEGEGEATALEFEEEAEEALPDPQAVAATLLAEAKEEAEQMIAAARQEAEQLLESTQQECAKLKADAEEEFAAQQRAGYETGYQEGLTAGQQAAQKEWEERLATAEETLKKAQEDSAALLKQAEEERRERILSSEQEILKLACGIAEKIISTELQQNPVQWLPMIGEAVKKVAGATEITIRVAQEDEAFMIEHLKEIRSQLSESPPLRLVSDSTLKPGDLIIQSNLGQIDARLKKQITRIFQALKEEGSVG
ncbi:MAG: hypothetical protein GX050_06350 [Firmicutes bacterium]|nr:hypothetical protein [Bacillota bacterium]